MLPEVPVVQHSCWDVGFVVLVALVAEIATSERANARFAVNQTDLTSTITTNALEVLQRIE